MSRKFSTRRRRVLEFQQSAMTDVIFQLIIFFLLTSAFVAQSGVNLNIPSTTSKPVPNQAKIVLAINRNNEIMVNDVKVSDDKLKETIAALLAKSTDKKVIVKADANLPLQDVVSLMDSAKQAGAQEIALATKATDKSATGGR